MKFDVVVGNPPYQNGGKSKGNKLWYQFIFKSHALVAEMGYVSMVTPLSWIRGGFNHGKKGVLKDIFAKEQLLVANISNITKKYFAGCGVDIGWWVFHKRPTHKKTRLILKDKTIYKDLKDKEVMCPVAHSKAISIFEKFIDSKYEKETVISFDIENPNKDVEPNNNHTEKHWVRGGTTKDNAIFAFMSKRFDKELGFEKILFPIRSYYWQPYLDFEKVGVLSQGFAIPIQKGWTEQGILSVYESKIWRLIFFDFQIRQNGFMKSAIVKKTPRMDLSRTWTDEELYEYFGLTQEEIDYIERALK